MGMLRVEIDGWRGMVGPVLVQGMREERDFDHIEPQFFSTSQAGGKGPAIGKGAEPVQDAMHIAALKALPVIISCQGGDYTNEVHPRLRAAGWNGYWIDAASALRMNHHAVIILDPVNMPLIKQAIADGTRNFIGGNCAASPRLSGAGRAFPRGRIEWRTRMTLPGGPGAPGACERERGG